MNMNVVAIRSFVVILAAMWVLATLSLAFPPYGSASPTIAEIVMLYFAYAVASGFFTFLTCIAYVKFIRKNKL